jgi:hypothetical protein
MNSTVPSLCIPRVFLNIDENRIRHIFNELDMGVIQRIDIVNKTTEKGEKFNRVFLHFARWFDTENAVIARERLLEGKEIKIIYDDPWFWKVSAYRETNKSYKRAPATTVQSKQIDIKQGESELKKMLGVKEQSYQTNTAGQRLLKAISNKQ